MDDEISNTKTFAKVSAQLTIGVLARQLLNGSHHLVFLDPFGLGFTVIHLGIRISWCFYMCINK